MLNKAVIQGRLTAAPELRHTAGGTPVTSFCMASERSFVKAGEERVTDFIDVVAWDKTAEFITRYFTKGQLIICEGEIQTRTYTDRNGNNRKAVEIRARNAYFSEAKRQEAHEFDQRPEHEEESFSQIIPDEEDLAVLRGRMYGAPGLYIL